MTARMMIPLHRAAIVRLLLVAAPAHAADEAARAPGEGPHEQRRFSVAEVAGFGSPVGIMGLTVDYAVAFPWGVELGGGLGASGYQLSARARRVWLPGPLRKFAWFVAGGPSVGALSKLLGTQVPHRDDQEIGDSDVYFTTWLNAGVGLEMRWDVGFLLRSELGAALRLYTNADDLCRGVDGHPDTAGESSCKSYHLPTAPEVARIIGFPYLSFSFGWSF